jgi:hypothetical protein
MRPVQFLAWGEQHNRLEQQLEQVKAEILDSWDSITYEMTQDWTQVALESWASLQGYYANMPDMPNIRGRNPKLDDLIDAGQAGFVDDIVQGMLNQMPTPQTIQDIRAVWWPALVEDDRDLEAAMQELEETQHAREEARQIAEMRRQEVQAAQNYLANAASPITQVVLDLERQVYEEVQGILDGIQQRGVIHHKQVGQLERLRELYTFTRIRDNDELIQAFDALAQAIATPEQTGTKKSRKKYDAEAIAGALQEITQAVSADALDPDQATLIGALEV